MGMQEDSGFCVNCNRQVLIRRPGANHVLHLILTLVTCFAWAFIWILCSIKIGGWRCSVCGSGVARSWGADDYFKLVLAGLVLAGFVIVTTLPGALRNMRETAGVPDKEDAEATAPPFDSEANYAAYLNGSPKVLKVGIIKCAVRQEGGGRRLIIQVDERWKALAEPVRVKYLQTIADRWRGFNPENTVHLLEPASLTDW